MRYQFGLVNLMAAPLLELGTRETVLTKTNFVFHRFSDLPAFRDRAAGWVVDGVAAPFVRILGVSDPTPAELADEARRRAA